MNRFFVFLSCFFLTVAFSANAQSANDPFCTLAPNDMVAALDGTWNLTQGQGFATAGPPEMTFVLPLPAHPPQPLTITYDPAAGIATATGAAPGETMLLVPTTPEGAAAVVGSIGEEDMEDYLEIGTGCDWYSIPLMIGTNIYSLDSLVELSPSQDAPDNLPNSVYGSFNGIAFRYCYDPYNPDPVFQTGRQDIPNGGGPQYNHSCDPSRPDRNVAPTIRVSEGQMSMSLAVKFQSPSSGTGILLFEGMKDGYPFAAKAPVRFSR
jgi:hypothetical protein